MDNFYISQKNSYYELHWRNIIPIDTPYQSAKLLDFIFIENKIKDFYLIVNIGNRLFNQFISYDAWAMMKNRDYNLLFRDVSKIEAIGLYTLESAEKLKDSIEKSMVWDALRL
jgi:hypothetical protein